MALQQVWKIVDGRKETVIVVTMVVVHLLLVTILTTSTTEVIVKTAVVLLGGQDLPISMEVGIYEKVFESGVGGLVVAIIVLALQP